MVEQVEHGLQGYRNFQWEDATLKWWWDTSIAGRLRSGLGRLRSSSIVAVPKVVAKSLSHDRSDAIHDCHGSELRVREFIKTYVRLNVSRIASVNASSLSKKSPTGTQSSSK